MQRHFPLSIGEKSLDDRTNKKTINFGYVLTQYEKTCLGLAWLGVSLGLQPVGFISFCLSVGPFAAHVTKRLCMSLKILLINLIKQ